MSVKNQKTNPIMYFHYAVVLFLCFVFPNLSPLWALTPLGMALVGAFLGAVYGWSFINMIWSSFAALLSMCWFIGTNAVLAAALGNTTIAMLIFMFVAMSVVTETGAVNWLLGKMLSMKFFLGKPWVTIGFLFYVSYLVAGFNSVIMALILIPILKGLFTALELEPYSKLPAAICIGVLYCLMMGQVTFPFLGVSFVLVAAYSAMFKTAIDFGSYLLFTVPLSVVMILLYLGVMKFIFRVDVSPFKKLTPEVLGSDAKATRDQKIALVFLVLFVFMALASSARFLGPIYNIMSRISIIAVPLLAMIFLLPFKQQNGKPMLDLKAPFSYDIIMITALVMVLSAYMNSPDYGIAATLKMIVAPLTNLSPYAAIVALLFIAVVATHFATNMVLCIIFMPFMVTIASAVGIAPTGCVALLFFSCQLALATPGGGAPVSALFYGIEDWVTVKMMSKLGLIAVIVLFSFDVILGLAWSSIIF